VYRGLTILRTAQSGRRTEESAGREDAIRREAVQGGIHMRVAKRLTLPIAAAAASMSVLAAVPATAAPAASATTQVAAAKAAPNAWAKLSLAQKEARLDQARKHKVLVAVTATLGARKRHVEAVRNEYKLAVAAEKAAAAKVTQADSSSVAAAQQEATRLAVARTRWAKMLPSAEADLWRTMRNREIARRALAQANARVKSVDAHEKWVVDTRARVVSLAKSRAGVSSYVRGGEGPYSFDCSGLTMWSYSQVGIDIPHYSGAQMVTGRAIPVALNQMVPGDLMYFGSGGSRHAAMYIGDGQVVQANNPSSGVSIDYAYASWNMYDYAGSTRLIY